MGLCVNDDSTGDWTYNNAPPANTTVTMTHIDPLTNVTSTYNTTVLVSDQIFMPSVRVRSAFASM